MLQHKKFNTSNLEESWEAAKLWHGVTHQIENSHKLQHSHGVTCGIMRQPPHWLWLIWVKAGMLHCFLWIKCRNIYLLQKFYYIMKDKMYKSKYLDKFETSCSHCWVFIKLVDVVSSIDELLNLWNFISSMLHCQCLLVSWTVTGYSYPRHLKIMFYLFQLLACLENSTLLTSYYLNTTSNE